MFSDETTPVIISAPRSVAAQCFTNTVSGLEFNIATALTLLFSNFSEKEA
jgi:hypothetical protein